MISDEIERLAMLRNSGALTEAEFQQAKLKLLSGSSPEPQAFVQQPNGTASSDQICGLPPKIWLSLMHVSQLLTWTAVGVVAPIIMWILSKDQSREANRHGLVILNWMLSSLVYAIISGLACFILIGIPMLAVLFALNIIFPIVGALKASNGTFWRYPFTINFFDPDAVV